MKSLTPILLAVGIGACNVPILYGFKKAYSQNPFVYAASFNVCSGLLMIVCTLFFGNIEHHYLAKGWPYIVTAGIGVMLMNLLAYYLINYYGAGYWIIASLCIMLLPSLLLGCVVFKEKFNLWIIPAILCALLTVFFFNLSKQ